MKKSIFIFASLFLSIVTCPIFAQADPGDDPLPAPIDDSIWILALFALTLSFVKFRAMYKKSNISIKE